MPQRFLRPGLRTSDAWNAASWFEQSYYVRLITLVDDEGRHDGRDAILHAECFALRDDVTRQQTAAAGSRLSALGLLVFYEVEGKRYLQLSKWQERVRNPSRIPPMPDDNRQPTAADGSQILPTSSHIPVPISPIPISHGDPTPAPTGAIAEKPAGSGMRQKPTDAEAEFHASKIGLPMSEVAKFMAFYDSKDWMVGKTPMRKWKAAMSGWKLRYEERRNKERTSGNSPHRVDMEDPAEVTALERRERIAMFSDNPWEICNKP